LYGDLLRIEACGSYRRGMETCGDVDVLFTMEDACNTKTPLILRSEGEILAQIVSELGSYLTDHLKGASADEKKQQRASTYFGVFQLRPEMLHRRIDLKVYPRSEWPFALLSFTGSGHFNRSMRLYARRAGFSLSDRDIRPARHARGIGSGAKIWTGKPVETYQFLHERDIFDFLGLTYREPHERNVDAAWQQEVADAAPGEKTSQSVVDGDSMITDSRQECSLTNCGSVADLVDLC